jgi:hypothetical protein
MSLLNNIRAKPEHVRKRYAFWLSFGFTAIVFAFWLGSFNSIRTNSQASVASAVEKAGSPASTMVASVGTFFKDIKEMVFGTKKVTYSSVEVRPGK